MKITGGCHCGDITFEAEADPEEHFGLPLHRLPAIDRRGVPHLGPRRSSARSRLLTGQPAIYIKTGESGNKRVQAFCERCGSPIYATVADGRRAEDLQYPRSVPCASATSCLPKMQIWCKSAQPWLADRVSAQDRRAASTRHAGPDDKRRKLGDNRPARSGNRESNRWPSTLGTTSI